MEGNGERATLQGRLYAYDRVLSYLLSRLPATEFALFKAAMLEEDSYPDWMSPGDILLLSEAREHLKYLLDAAEKFRGIS